MLNFAVFGDSFVRKVSNYFVHKPNAVRNNQVVIDALNRVQELVDKYKEERQALREDASKLEAEDEEIAEFASKSKSVDNQNSASVITRRVASTRRQRTAWVVPR